MSEHAHACRSCGSTMTRMIIDLGDQPAADHFPPADDPGPDPTWPLALGQCELCYLLQLFGDDAPVPETPLAVESETSKAHAVAAAQELVTGLGLRPGTTVIEFDSAHGGSWLPALETHGLRPIEDGQADLVVDVHGLIHASFLDAALADRAAHVGPDGRFVMEFHHALQLVTQRQFDTIRHGHPVYLSLIALRPALARHGLHMLSAVESDVYGGSLILVSGRTGAADESIHRLLDAERDGGLAGPDALHAMNHELRAAAEGLREWLARAAGEGRKVLGYGAPSKAPVLLNLAGVGPDLLEFTADLSPAKQGRRLPVTGIPIRSPEDLVAANPDDVLIFTWDIADEVRAQLEGAGLDAAFWLPLPRVRPL